MRLAIIFALCLLAAPANAGTVAAVYYNTAGEITMVVIPDNDSELFAPQNQESFSPKGQTRVLVPRNMFDAVQSPTDLKAVTAELLDRNDKIQADLGLKLDNAVLQALGKPTLDVPAPIDMPADVSLEVGP